MPGGAAGHLGGVVGDDDAVESLRMQDAQHSRHVDIAVIDKGLLVVRRLTVDIPQVDVAELALGSVMLGRSVNIGVGHFSHVIAGAVDAFTYCCVAAYTSASGISAIVPTQNSS